MTRGREALVLSVTAEAGARLDDVVPARDGLSGSAQLAAAANGDVRYGSFMRLKRKGDPDSLRVWYWSKADVILRATVKGRAATVWAVDTPPPDAGGG